MAGLRITRFGAAALAAAVILTGCSLTGGVRQAPNPNNTVTGRPPTELSRMDSAAVAIFNAAAPHNAATAGASAQDMIGRNATAGSYAPNSPGGAATGTGNGVGGAVQPGANNTGGGTGMTGTTGAGTGGTGTTGTGTTGTGKGTVPGPGTTGTGTTGTGTTGTGTSTGTGGTGTTGTGTTGTGTTGTGTTGTGTTGAGTATGTATGTGTTASPGTTTPRTSSTAVPAVDWTRIQGEYNTVKASWKVVRANVQKQGANTDMLSAVDSAVATLGTAVSSRSAMPTAFAANDLTAYLAALLGLYRPGTPVQIYQMEYMAREVELDTESGNSEGALDAARSIGGVWVSLRTTAMARNKAHAGAVDTEVGRLEKSAASGANLNLRSEAATLLRDLDTLTRDFLTATR